MENNIFYFAGNTPVNVKEWNPSGNKTYSNNLYYNVKNYPNDAAPVKVNAGTKVLENAGSGPDSVATDKAARKHEDPTKETVFDGYKLAEKSPAINKGKVVVDRNGYTIDHDFFGHAITAVPEIGAAESDVVADTLILRSNVYKVDGTNVSELPKNTTVDAFLKNIIVDTGVKVTVKDGEKVLEGTDVVKGGATIVLSYEGKTDVTYTVVASSDKELKASYYEVRGTEVQVPYTEKNPTTVKELKANLTVADTATVSVVNAEKELADKDAVADGMTLRITAEDGTTNDYAIKQKNEYNWTKDFINGQQGNVWFGQMKDGSGDWANMTSVDKDGWPNWATHTYYGPGIDDDQHVTTASSPDKHGLLSAPPSTNISTAMAYRVPKSGTVSFKVRDGEPYLRQSPNEGGTVTLSLYVNGTEKKNLTLETSKKKEGNWEKAEEIEVTRGDIIRVVAKCNGNPSKPSAHITPIITYVDKAAADKEAPTVPADVKASEIAHTGAKLTWTASKDNVEVAGYNVYLNDEKVNEELITGTEYDLADLTANTEYNVTVTAVDAAGNESEKSEAATFTTLKGADLTELTATIAEAEKILKAEDKDKYSAAALVELQELVNAGKLLTATSTQEAVDKKKDEITAKLADIQTQFTITATAGEGGKIELKDEIKEKAKDETSYETKAYKGTSKVFTITPDKGYHIESITVDETDVKDIVKEYTFKDITEDHTIAVTFAKDGLTVAKENLLATINTAKEKLAEKDAYTPESVKELEEAVEAAQKVYDKEDSTKEEVDAAEKAVQAAQKALVEKETPKPEAPVKKDELKAAVEDATKVVGDTEQYTEESLAALQSAIDAANAVLQNPEATQAEIDAAVKAVKEAKEALKVKEDKKDDNNKGDDSNKGDNKKDDGNSGASNNGSSNGGSNNNGSSNTGSTNTGSGNKGTTSTGSTTSHAVKTGDTTNVVTWLFALAASAAAGLGVVKRKKED